MAKKSSKKVEAEREKLRNTIIIILFCFVFLTILAIVWLGVSSPQGLENYFKHMFDTFLNFLDTLRFKSDIFFRFLKSLVGQ